LCWEETFCTEDPLHEDIERAKSMDHCNFVHAPVPRTGDFQEFVLAISHQYRLVLAMTRDSRTILAVWSQQIIFGLNLAGCFHRSLLLASHWLDLDRSVFESDICPLLVDNAIIKGARCTAGVEKLERYFEALFKGEFAEGSFSHR